MSLVKVKEFNIDNWNRLLLSTSDSYRHMKNYVDNEKSKSIHLDSIYITQMDLDKGASLEISAYEYNNDILNTYLLNKIDRAFFHYSNQLIVLFASYLEIIVKEYFAILFYNFPDKMYDYLCLDENDKQKRKVDIKTALSFTSIEELKLKIADESAIKASKGKIRDVLKRINKLCGNIIIKDLVDEINTLVDKRNKIVHELVLIKIYDKDIYQIRTKLFELIKAFGSFLKSKDITIVDTGGIVP